jgi:hypothetical protein
MKHILITGVSGYFGQRLVRFFRDKPEITNIAGIDVKQPSVADSKFEFLRCDVRNDLDRLFLSRDIDCVIHSAYILPPIHDIVLMEDINVNGTKNVLNTAARHGVKQDHGLLLDHCVRDHGRRGDGASPGGPASEDAHVASPAAEQSHVEPEGFHCHRVSEFEPESDTVSLDRKQ